MCVAGVALERSKKVLLVLCRHIAIKLAERTETLLVSQQPHWYVHRLWPEDGHQSLWELLEVTPSRVNVLWLFRESTSKLVTHGSANPFFVWE